MLSLLWAKVEVALTLCLRLLEGRSINDTCSWTTVEFILSWPDPPNTFPPTESVFFRPEAAKKDFARKPNLKKACLSEKQNMLKMCISHAFFGTDLEIQGVKNAKNWGKMPIFEGSTCKFPYETAIFAYKAIWPNPPNPFSPTRICDFPFRRRKNKPMANTQWYASGKRPLRAKRKTVWRFFCGDLAFFAATSRSRGLKIRSRCSKNMAL